MKRLMPLLMFGLLALHLGVNDLRAEDVGPCAEEVTKFCKEVQPGGDRIMNCLQEHEQELSPACREHEELLQRKARRAFPECKADVERFCMDVRAMDRRIIRCLLQHKDDLSAECKNRMNAEK